MATSSRVSVARSAVADAFTTTSYRFPPGAENTALSYVTLANVRADLDHLAMGTSQGEVLDVDGVIFHKVPGGTEVQSAVAEDAAFAVLKELTDALISDSTLGGTGVFHCDLVSYESSVETQSGDVVARIDFTVSVQSHI